MKRLEGKAVIVTGGGSGIGKGACQRIADEGGQVVVAEAWYAMPGATFSSVVVGTETVPKIEYDLTDNVFGDDSRVIAEILATGGPALVPEPGAALQALTALAALFAVRTLRRKSARR